jgi:hypothetical protein
MTVASAAKGRGGIPVLFSYGLLPADSQPNYGATIAIRNSNVFCSLSRNQDGSVYNPYAAFITIVQGCPQRVIVEGVTGPSDVWEPVVQAAPGYNLAIYLQSRVAAAQLIKVSVDSNLINVGAGVVGIDPSLMAYVNPFESSPLPMGARRGTPLGASSQASFLYHLPTNAAGAGAFVAMVTISVNPNPYTGNSTRTSASYLVSIVTNWDTSTGVLRDYVTWTPLAQPALPSVLYPPPAIVSMQFDPTSSAPPPLGSAGSDGTGFAARASANGAGGQLQIVWDSNAGVPVASPAISIQPLHFAM